jgi:predicted dehydrogenase
MKKLRLGLLGTGIAAKELYLPAWKQLEHRIELVACANRTREKAERFARLAGFARVVGSAEELFALPELDAVVVSLPIESQPKFVLAALRAGKAVLSEKPVGPSVAAARSLIKAAKRFERPWLVGENFAFMGHAARLAELVKKGSLGEVRLVEAVQMTFMDAKNPYFATPWRAKPGHVGGFVTDGGVHVANVLRRCFGMPKVVKQLTASFEPSLPPLDTAVALLRFDSGALGTWTSCFSAHYHGPLLRVYGKKATAELSWGELVVRQPGGSSTTFKPKHDSFRAEFEHFADVVLRGHPLAVTPESALEDLVLLETLVRGAKK